MYRWVTLFLAVWVGSAYAEPVEDAEDQLSGTLTEIQAASKKHHELEGKQSALEREMKTLQEETVNIARDAKQQEEALLALEEKNLILENEKKEKLTALEARRAEFSDAMAAMIRLSRMPPEAVIAMPGKLDETLSAARALSAITRSVEDEASVLRSQLHELEALEQKIAKNRSALLQKKENLVSRHKQLEDKIQERSKIHLALGGEAKSEQARIEELTERSKTLQDLVDTLGKAEKVEESLPAMQPAIPRAAQASSKLGKARSFAQSRGKMGLPAAGKIVGLYGHSEGGAAFSKGVMIESRESAGVVAPYDGEVVYAGVFRDYGKMVIIRHKGDYHTLLSGMGSINCTTGQFLLEGEPIGTMGKPAEGARPHLYVEMRRNGKPIDPMAWFKG